jgi:hypothetical protein
LVKTVHKIAVVGSRDYQNEAAVRRFVRAMNPINNVLISGGARGVDTWAADEFRKLGGRVVEYRPNYTKHGRGAPLHRNSEIVLGSDDVAAFWDGESTGTLDTVRKTIKAGKTLAVFGPDGNLMGGVTEKVAAMIRERKRGPKRVIPRG